MPRSNRSETKPALAEMIGPGSAERDLELRRSSGLNVEDGLFRDHPRIIAKRHRLTGRPSYTCGYTSGGMVTADEGH